MLQEKNSFHSNILFEHAYRYSSEDQAMQNKDAERKKLTSNTEIKRVKI